MEEKSTLFMKRAGLALPLQRQLTALGIECNVVCPQKLDERNKRVKTDGLDAKALCLKLDRFVQGNREALALVRVPTEEEEQKRAIHRQREQLVKTRKVLEAQGRSLMVNYGMEPLSNWWKARTFAQLQVPERLEVPLPPDRIDQIAALAAVRCADRSKSRWNTQNQRAIGRGSVARETRNPN
jgi:transposase